MNSVKIFGLTPSNQSDDRTVISLHVVYNNENFDWKLRMPPSFQGSFQDFVDINSEKIYADIQEKLDEWDAHPKTKTIQIMDENENLVDTTVEVLKEEIVKPTYPDYYVLRAKEYPSIYEQLDCLWKDNESLQQMRNKILEIKEKYPKK